MYSTMNLANCYLLVVLLLASSALTSALSSQSELESMFLRFYFRNDSHTDVSLREAKTLVPMFDPDEPVVLYISGLSENTDGHSVVPMVNAFLNHTTVNILALDYRRISMKFYPLAVLGVEDVGKRAARAIEDIIAAGVNRKNIRIIGHSLGAQVTGFIGRSVKSKLPWLTGLDPAGPLYYLGQPHLSASDADFVDIIHTDAGFYGLALHTGTVDFFPNFGTRPQPGCPVFVKILSDEDFCAHHRSWWFFIESIKKKDAFVGVKCSDAKKYKSKKCNSNEQVIMGYYTSTKAKGSFYLTTNAESPYGQGEEGATYTK